MTDEMWAQFLVRLKKGYDISNLPSFETMLKEIEMMEIFITTNTTK